MSSAFLTYPLDTIRRQMMMQSGKKVKTFSSSMDCLAQLMAKEGPAALYRGALSNSLKSTSGALMVALYYEAIKYM